VAADFDLFRALAAFWKTENRNLHLQIGFWNPNGTWDVENHGVDPAYEIVMDPAAVKAGHDPQLEKAVEVALGLLAKTPSETHETGLSGLPEETLRGSPKKHRVFAFGKREC
jgi:hypothetical protein